MLTLKDIYAARRRVQRWARRTPMEHSPALSEVCGGEVWLKLENQQLTGSFKIRGATNKLLLLSPEERGRGVVTASSGNHAQGLGYAARELGVRATIVVPEHTPRVKIDAIRRYGVELIIEGEEYMDSERLARRLEREQGKVFVSAYNDLELIAGQGTVGLEMLEDHPDLDVVLVPAGGGGLISGVATVFKEVGGVEVVGVQSAASPVMYECVKRGKIVDISLEDSVAEGLHGGIEEDSVTFNLCRRLVDDWVIVEEDSIKEAIRLMLREHRMVVEGAAAVGVAAITENPGRFRGRKVGAVISGGNLDLELVNELFHGF